LVVIEGGGGNSGNHCPLKMVLTSLLKGGVRSDWNNHFTTVRIGEGRQVANAKRDRTCFNVGGSHHCGAKWITCTRRQSWGLGFGGS